MRLRAPVSSDDTEGFDNVDALFITFASYLLKDRTILLRAKFARHTTIRISWDIYYLKPRTRLNQTKEKKGNEDIKVINDLLLSKSKKLVCINR